MPLPNHEIDRIAAEWAARRDLRPLSAEESAEFADWLAADPRHLGAYGRAEAVLCRLERLSAITRDPVPAEEGEGAVLTRRRMVMAGGATAAMASAIGFYIVRPGRSPATLSTQIGQLREILLPDGSIVSLNTNSEISVLFTPEARNISLLNGEALFDVVKDSVRPFTVSAGDTSVRAVGTSFTVSRLPHKPIQVLVKEGVVELQRNDTPQALPVRASANIQAIASPGAPIVTVAMPEEKVARDLEWQNGRIALDNETLSNAAAEFARYSEVRIAVDPSISNRTVTGLFAANDPIGFARAAASVLKLQTDVKGDEVRIFRDE